MGSTAPWVIPCMWGATPKEVSYNLVWNNTTANYNLASVTNSYFNLSQDPLFATAPQLSFSSPCLNAGKPSISANIRYYAALSCEPVIQSIPEKAMIKETVSIYPNPNNGTFMLQFPSMKEPALVIFYNSVGQKVFERVNVGSEETFDLSHLPKGVYFFHLKSEKSVATGKLILN
jgi:hypothetical protein